MWRFLKWYIFLFPAFLAAQHTCPVSNLWQNGDFENTNLKCLKLNGKNAISNTASPYFGSATFRWQPTTVLQPGALDEAAKDHTLNTSSGYYFYIDPRTKTGWDYEFFQDIQVETNTNYTFSMWYCSMNISTDAPATIRLAINGVAITSAVTITNQSQTWKKISGTWNSGTATKATAALQTQDANIAGHNFAIDDIVFGTGKIIIDAGKDTTLCPNTQIYLGINRVAALGVSCDNSYNYTWEPAANFSGNNKISSPKLLNPIKAGMYSVTVTDYNGNTCSDTMYIKLASNIPKTLNVFKDTAFCLPFTYDLTLSNSFILTKWEDGSTKATRTFNAYGKYWIDFTDLLGCVLFSDTFTITPKQPVLPFDLKDTAVCPGQPVLRSVAGWLKTGRSVLWNDGDTSRTRTLTTSGLHWVKITGPCNSHGDTFFIAPITESRIKLPGLIQLCNGEDTLLRISYSYKPVLWQDGDTSHAKIIRNAGKIKLNYKAACNWYTDSTTAISVPATLFSLGADDTVCFSNPKILKAPAAAAYLWNDGSNKQTFAAGAAGVYFVTITNSLGCKSADTIQFFESDSSQQVFIPSAFTPDDNDRNDFFPAKSLPYQAKLEIFNRWGELVFGSQTNPAWNGRFGDKPAQEGVYIYFLTYMDCTNNRVVKKGSVHVLR